MVALGSPTVLSVTPDPCSVSKALYPSPQLISSPGVNCREAILCFVLGSLEGGVWGLQRGFCSHLPQKRDLGNKALFYVPTVTQSAVILCLDQAAHCAEVLLSEAIRIRHLHYLRPTVCSQRQKSIPEAHIFTPTPQELINTSLSSLNSRVYQSCFHQPSYILRDSLEMTLPSFLSHWFA